MASYILLAHSMDVSPSFADSEDQIMTELDISCVRTSEPPNLMDSDQASATSTRQTHTGGEGPAVIVRTYQYFHFFGLIVAQYKRQAVEKRDERFLRDQLEFANTRISQLRTQASKPNTDW